MSCASLVPGTSSLALVRGPLSDPTSLHCNGLFFDSFATSILDSPASSHPPAIRDPSIALGSKSHRAKGPRCRPYRRAQLFQRALPNPSSRDVPSPSRRPLPGQQTACLRSTKSTCSLSLFEPLLSPQWAPLSIDAASLSAPSRRT